MLSHEDPKVKLDNYTLITLEGINEKMTRYYTSKGMDQFTLGPWNLFEFVQYSLDFTLDLCIQDIEHETLRSVLLGYPKNFKFDLILWDHIAGECLYPLVERFGNPPLIGLSPYGVTNLVEDIYGGHVYPYVGQVVMPFAEAHGLWRRLWNAIYVNYHNYRKNTWFKRRNVEVSRKVFPNWNREKYEDVERRFSLGLVNWNVALNPAQAFPPNIKPIGGVHINPMENLSKNLDDIFKKAHSGVIYFSLGSIVKSETFTPQTLNAMGQCFADLPQYEVIWKIVIPPGVTLPPNVHNVTWAPQTAILSQPRTKVFITHGGGLSIQEATFFGVPILGIPVFLDQFNNVDKVRAKGGGESLTLSEIHQQGSQKAVQEVFCERLKKVLLNDAYKRVMKRLSAIYRDVKVEPLEEALFWVGYVLRHGDVRFLSPWSRNADVIQTQNFDIYGILIFVLLFLGVLTWFLLSFFVRIFMTRVRKEKND